MIWRFRIRFLFLFLILFAVPARAEESVSFYQLQYGPLPPNPEMRMLIRKDFHYVNLSFLNQYLHFYSQWDPETGNIRLQFGKIQYELTKERFEYRENEATKMLPAAPWEYDDQLWIPIAFLERLGLIFDMTRPGMVQVDWEQNYLLRMEVTQFENRPAFLLSASKVLEVKAANLLVGPDRLLVELAGIKLHPAFHFELPQDTLVSSFRNSEWKSDVRLTFDLRRLTGYQLIRTGPQEILLVLNSFVTDVKFFQKDTERKVMIETSAPSNYRILTLSNPHRYIIDLEGTTLGTTAGTITGDGGWVRSVRWAQYNSQTVRVVLDLPDPANCFVVRSHDNPKIIEVRTLQSITAINWKADEWEGQLTIRSDGELRETVTMQKKPDKLLLELPFSQFAKGVGLPSHNGVFFTKVRALEGQPDRIVLEFELNRHITVTTHHTADRRETTFFFKRAPLQGKTFVIDPGHGGVDPGACGGQGLQEKDVTIEVAFRLKDHLEQAGAEVVLTRTGDYYLSLFERPFLANFCHADLFISIHSNSYIKDKNTRGVEVYYNPEHGMGKVLAQMVLDQVISQTGLVNRGIKTNNFPVIMELQMPGILVELGYLSNFEEETLLKTVAFRENAALGLFNGLLKYFQ